MFFIYLFIFKQIKNKIDDFDPSDVDAILYLRTT